MDMTNIKLTVDAVVFGYEDGLVSVLLVKRKYEPYQGAWALPGGFVKSEESLESAVQRELQEETGVKINYLEQLYTFGEPTRDPRGRVVSVAYFGLIRPDAFRIAADTDAEEVQWFDINDLPNIAFDHAKVLLTAISRLQGKMIYEPIGFELLDQKFSFSDLEKLYSSLLGVELDRRNFRKKIQSFGILDELNETASKSTGRPAKLFQFNQKRYFELKKEGILFDIKSINK
ncbi:NUDIX hydrolase [Reichenbachiella sp. 5M10]|uniref:NUDIX hydrolase n=1 Tax=Reichenbachiella sp. 5M10 TaxID=1889772 RepID=UPI000C14E2D0|nr:NUDIX domain-containing protein [Reichenbachiella sp. 5M10]PIB37531.1 NUDIX hydrolase [Reichenbachiella sp. 5M10]